MRAYFSPGAGLGDREVSALKRLSPNSRMLILDELQHPDSHGTVKWILNHRDPEAALADAIAENIHQASSDAATGTGLGDGLGKSFFKKLAKLHRKIFHSVVKVQKKIFKADPIHKAVFGGRKKRPGTPAAPAATAASPAASSDPGPSAPPPVYTPPPTPDASQYTQMATQGPVNYVQEQPPDVKAEPTPPSDATPAPTSTPDTSSIYPTGTDETAGLPSASGYTLVVEGQTITNYPVPLSTLSSLIQSGTQPGDRFEIMADGVGTGLRVRTATGFISIPESARAQVMAMPHDQVLSLLTQAASTVAAAGVPTPDPAPPQIPASSGGNVWLWLGGAGTLAALAASSVGKRR